MSRSNVGMKKPADENITKRRGLLYGALPLNYFFEALTVVQIVASAATSPAIICVEVSELAAIVALDAPTLRHLTNAVITVFQFIGSLSLYFTRIKPCAITG